MASSSPTPGILYVTMQPKPTLPIAQFHDWYNNEHGPGRLRLSFCQNGFRYRATDLSGAGTGSQDKPEWMAIYDIEDMEWLTKDVYTSLRQAPKQSQRERDTMKQIHVDRRFYDGVKERKGTSFQPLEHVGEEGTGNRLVAEYTAQEPGEEELARVGKTEGWRRSRVFVTSYLDVKDGREKEYLTLHEYAPSSSVQETEAKRRSYDLYYTFGPAPRDLSSLSSPDTVAVESTDGLTKSFPAHIFSTPSTTAKSYPIISSFITTPDDVILPYRLSGSADPAAPMLVLINSILTTHDIWSTFTAVFLTLLPNYRVVAYNTRGRSSLPSSASSDPVTVQTLSDDVITILDALRVKKAAVVGVSLGGATALNVALSYPDRVQAFVSCDTNSSAPPGNKKAWGERLEMCEKEGAKAASGEALVGNDLAEVTVRRWFTEGSYADKDLKDRIDEVTQMVSANSLSGFRASVNALYAYDFRSQMTEFKGKGAFLVGAQDGVLPKTMKEMASSLGQGVELKSIEGAGHLPMVERPLEVAQFVAEFLG